MTMTTGSRNRDGTDEHMKSKLDFDSCNEESQSDSSLHKHVF